MNIPHNETETILWFEREGPAHDYRIETLRTGYPDAIVRHGEKILLVEFEFESDNFFSHEHNPDRCDLIVCWKHNGRKLPLPCLELQLPSWWEQRYAAYAAPIQLSLDNLPVWGPGSSDGKELIVSELEAANRSLQLQLQQTLSEWRARLTVQNAALERLHNEIEKQRTNYRSALRQQRDYFLRRSVEEDRELPPAFVVNKNGERRTPYPAGRIGGRPSDPIAPVVAIISELIGQLGRNPSSNEIYRAGRILWGVGPNRDKVKRAWAVIDEQTWKIPETEETLAGEVT